jgi:hypothetical protein
MPEKNFYVSASQVFCLVFFYLLSGMMLFCGGEFFPALFASLFSVCLCAVAFPLCKSFCSSSEFFVAVFGKLGSPLRYIAAFFAALPLARTLFAFSAEIFGFYGAQQAQKFAPFLALFAVFAVARGFQRAARFAEVAVFALVGAILLALFGGGEGVRFNFGESALFAGFETVGASPVIFSLCLRSVSAESEKASVFAKNSSFRPSPFFAGVCAALASLAVYAFFCFAGRENILFSLLFWFFAFTRLLLFSLCVADLTAYPEKGEGAKRAFAAALFCAFWLIFGAFYPRLTSAAGIFAAVLFPCIVFAASVKAKAFSL